MIAALADEPVLCGDETPVNIAHKDTDEHGTPVPGLRTWSPWHRDWDKGHHPRMEPHLTT